LPPEIQTEGTHRQARGFSDRWLPAVILLLAALPRLYGLGFDSLRIDEISTFGISRLPAGTILTYWGGLPLLFLKTKIFTTLSYSNAALRFPSLVEGLLGVLAIYYLGKHLFCRTTGILAAALLAVSPMAIYYSQDARYYAFLMTVSTLATLFLFKGLEEGGGWWFLFWLASLLNFLNHTSSWLVLMAHCLIGLFWMLRDTRAEGGGFRLLTRKLMPLAGSAGAVVILYTGLVLPRLLAMEGGEWWRKKFETAPDAAASLTTGSLSMEALLKIIKSFGGTDWWWISILFLLIFLAVSFSSWKPLGLSLTMIIIPLLILTIYGVRKWEIRYLIFGLPIYLLLLAEGWRYLTMRLVGQRSSIIRFGTMAFLVLVTVISSHSSLMNHYRTPRQSWKEAALLVRDAAGGKDQVIVRGPRQAECLLYYLDRNRVPEVTLGSVDYRFDVNRESRYALDHRTGELEKINRTSTREWLEKGSSVWQLHWIVSSLMQRRDLSDRFLKWAGNRNMVTIPFHGTKSDVYWLVRLPDADTKDRLLRWRKLAERALSLAPRDQGLHLLNAQLLMAEGENDRAGKLLRKAVELDRLSPHGLMAAGFLHALEGRAMEAYSLYREAFREDPLDLHASLGYRGAALVSETSGTLFPMGSPESAEGDRTGPGKAVKSRR
jgi:hypothetical protein